MLLISLIGYDPWRHKVIVGGNQTIWCENFPLFSPTVQSAIIVLRLIIDFYWTYQRIRSDGFQAAQRNQTRVTNVVWELWEFEQFCL